MTNEPKLIEGKIKIHPIALLIPEMDQSDFEALKEDISGLGLINPVVLYEGMILDGRHRYQACQELGIDCYGRDWEGGMDPVEYVVSENVKRRHLNQGQKAMVKLNCANFYVDDAKRRQREALARGNETKHSKDASIVATLPQSTNDPEPQKEPVRVRNQIGKILNVSAKTVGDAQKVLNHGTPEEKRDALSGKKSVNKVAAEIRERKKAEPRPAEKQTFNETNDNIEWAPYSWNPVTGCKMGCPYCYARDIGMRFNNTFEPAFHPERLDAPKNTKVKPGKPNNVFVCSMADLFGDWVPAEWIEAVIATVSINPQWNFLFLTKNPKRYLEFEFPENCWLGATSDNQERADNALDAFGQMYGHVRFLSCEPLMGSVDLGDDPPVDWIIIGGRSKSSGMEAGQPKWEWVRALLKYNHIPVYFKPNLTVRPQEMPNQAR